MRASTFQGGQCRGFFCFESHMSLVLETVRRHSILTSLKRRWLSMESRIRFTVKEWRQEICGKTSSEYLGRKTARWMQETFLPETDSLYSWISGIWDNDLHGSGLRLVNTKERVQLAINRKASGFGNVECHIFILSDAQLIIINRELEKRDLLTR